MLILARNQSPAQVFPEPSHFFRADTLVTSVGVAVSAWRDVLNEGISFLQANNANRPIKAINAAGFDVIQYAGSNKFLTLNGSITPQTIVALIRIDQFPAYARVIDRNVGNDSGIHLGTLGFQLRFDDAAGKRVVVGPAQTSLRMVSVVTSTTTSSAFARTFGSSTSLGADRNWPAGNYQLGRTSQGFNGDVVELSIFNTELTQAEVLAYENSRYDYYIPPPSIAAADTLLTDGFCAVILDAGDRFETYLWDDGSVAQTYEATGEGWHSVSVTDFFGRTLSDSIYIRYPGNFLTNSQFCLGETIVYDPGLTEPSFSFEWSTGETSPSITLSEAGVYDVVITDQDDCIFSPPSFVVEVDSFPLLASILAPEVFCSGNTLTVESGGSAISTYLWSTGSTEESISPIADGIYWVELANSNACISQDTVSIVIAGNSPNVVFSNTFPCAGTQVAFTDLTEPDGIITSSIWTLNGTVVSGSVAETVFNNPGFYPVELSIVLNNGCSGIGRDTIDVRPSPLVDFDFPTVCAGSEVEFSDISTIGSGSSLVLFEWNFGNGETGLGQNVSTVFTAPGPYTVTLEVTSNEGCTSSQAAEIIAFGADISAPYYNAVCRGLTHMFRSDTLVTLSGGNVSAWTNILDPTVSFVQNTSNNRPGFGANAFGLNTIAFSGANKALVLNSSIQPETIVILLKVTTFPSYARILNAVSGNNDSGIHLGIGGFQGRFDDAASKRVLFGSNVSTLTFLSVASSSGVNPAAARVFGEEYLLGPDRNWLSGSYLLGGTTTSLTGEVVEISIFTEELSLAELAFYENARMDYYVAPLNISAVDTIDAPDFCGLQLDAGERFETYTWSDGTTNQTTVTSSPGWYAVEVVDFFGRIFLDSVFVRYPGNYLESFELCLNETVEWDLSLNPSHFNFLWSTSATTPSIPIFEAGTFGVTVSDTLGCSFTAEPIDVTIDLFPETAALIDLPTFCLGNTLALATGAEEAQTYLWSTGEQSPSIIPQADGTYWVEATNANGCVGRDTVEVAFAGVAPEVSFEVGLACANTPLVLSDTTVPETGVAVAWNWTFPTSTASGETVAITVPAAGGLPVELHLLLDNGCTGTARDTVMVAPQPLVGFNFDAVIPCAGNPVAFQSASGVPGGGFVTAYAWVFGNGTTAMGATGITTFADQGPQTVRHIVTSDAGCKDSLQVVVAVLGSPVANFSVADVCVGQPVVLVEEVDISQSGPVFYNWQFGDGFFSNFPATSHVYAGAGLYNVTLTATGNSFGNPGCVDAITLPVRVYPAPVGLIEVGDACLGDALALTDLSQPQSIGGVADPIASRTWTSGGVIGGDSLQFWTPSAVGTIAVQFSALTAAGCTLSATGTATVLAPPTADFELDIPLQSPPLAINTDNLSVGAESFVWLDGEGNVLSTDFEPSLTFAEAGNYVVVLQAANDLGCIDESSQAFSLIVPTYDIGLIDIRYTLQGGTLALRPVIINNGNVPVDRFDLKIDLGLSAGLMQTAVFDLPPGAITEVSLPQMFGYLPDRDLPYVCMEIDRPNGQADADSSNNFRCVGLDRSNVTFIPPYPNPTRGVVNLGFVLPRAAPIEVAVSTADGKRVADFSISLEAGYTLFPYDMRGLGEGIYFIKYAVLGEVEVVRVVLVED